MEKPATLTFTGDIGFDKYFRDSWHDTSVLSPRILEFLKDSDHLIVNVEGPLYDAASSGNGDMASTLIHSMDPGAGAFLSDIGADIWCICNNHIMDAGPDGIKSTIDTAKAQNARTVGAGMNISEASSALFLDEAGGIGIICVGYQRACRKAGDDTPGCFSWSDISLIEKRIKEIKERCRWCIVIAHAGEEFTAIPSPYTRERYLSYLDMGADIVIAHHPHVVNNYELFDKKAVFYSLGNLIFDTDYQRSQMYTQFGVILKLSLYSDRFSFEPLGIEVIRNNGFIDECPLPDIFTDIRSSEYELLHPLGAKVLIENTKRQLRYMKPDVFADATEEDFYNDFFTPLRSGRVPGETLDMQIIYPLSQRFFDGGWKKSTLPDVVSYMLSMIPSEEQEKVKKD